MAYIFTNICVAYFDRKIFDSAYFYYVKGKDYISKTKNDFISGIIENNIGEIKMKEKKI